MGFTGPTAVWSLLATAWCAEAGKKFSMSSHLTKRAAKSVFMMQTKNYKKIKFVLYPLKQVSPFKRQMFPMLTLFSRISFHQQGPQPICCQQSDVPFKFNGLT